MNVKIYFTHMDHKFNPEYWDQRYSNQMVGWDAGSVTEPIKTYVDQLNDKEICILVPGSGYGYEAAYLWKQGFRNTFVCEWSTTAAERFRDLHPDFPSDQVLNQDFFTLQGQFDLILEQTFFCALMPAQRSDYASKVYELLKDNGKLVGLLFDFPLEEKGPPFGGNTGIYLSYFQEGFKINQLENCYNSIKPRSGKELFINFSKQIK